MNLPAVPVLADAADVRRPEIEQQSGEARESITRTPEAGITASQGLRHPEKGTDSRGGGHFLNE
jgi:hypothetical protein